MHVIALLKKFAKNAHHRISILEYIESQPANVREAFLTNNNAELRRILGGDVVNFPDRDKVVCLER